MRSGKVRAWWLYEKRLPTIVSQRLDCTKNHGRGFLPRCAAGTSANKSRATMPCSASGSVEVISVELPPDPIDDSSKNESKKVRTAVRLSLIGNVALFAMKLYAFCVSRSQAVLASLIDSAVDIASQFVVYFCDRKMRKVDHRYPIGKTKLQTLGAIIIACIMTLGAAEVIGSAARQLGEGIGSANPPIPEMNVWMYTILGAVVGLKTVLYLMCFVLRNLSDSTMVLAEDHLNDVLSNTVAIAAAAIATNVKPKTLWWIDPVGGILISAYIVWSWIKLARTQVDKIIGLGAPDEFVSDLERIANTHDPELEVDVIRAYHFGAKYFVEVDVVVPAMKTVAESHDVALGLQKKIEMLNDVERAFVHVDYQKRDGPEHKIDWSPLNGEDKNVHP
ncbi:hypothetical protein BSKO_00078 [Bryopsis sp. KO-2023]|nr:hypothetical protein BSKO_00078 [Bryopsis sp. KO-2023]